MEGRADRHVLTEFSQRLEDILRREDGQTSKKVSEILNILQCLQIDPLLIRNAKIILTINNLRKKINNEEVIRLSKGLLRNWKNSVIKENNEIKDVIINGWNERTPKVRRKLEFRYEFNNILKSDTSDENRIKSRDLLAKALMSDECVNEDLLKIAKIATNIEKFVFEEFNKTDAKYKTRIRSRVSNLSDENNIELREQVLKGIITEEEVAKMSSEELASDRMKKLRKRFSKESLSANILPEVFGTETELLKCPECKGNHCTYNQVQIDRADEPMTTLCLCITCGHRWRFN